MRGVRIGGRNSDELEKAKQFGLGYGWSTGAYIGHETADNINNYCSIC